MLEREPSLRLQGRQQVARDQSQAQLDVAEQPSLRAALDLGAVAELARLAEVVDDRGAEQKVAVQAGVQSAQLERNRRHGHRVLEQPAQVRVVSGEGAASAGGPRYRA